MIATAIAQRLGEIHEEAGDDDQLVLDGCSPASVATTRNCAPRPSGSHLS
jgi:hypothetical protein